MGAGNTGKVVVDAGPVIHLNEIASISLLFVFDEVHMTDAVWAEVVTPSRVEAKQLAGLTHLHVHRVELNDVVRFVFGAGVSTLHVGEQTSLFLAHKLGIALFLTDDLAARDAAKRLGFHPVGSLGVIARACMRGLLDVASAVELMRTLQQRSTLFVTDQIVELAIQTLYRQMR